MLSFKFYQTIIRPNASVNTLRCYRALITREIKKNSQRLSNVKRFYSQSNVAKIAMFGLTGSMITYVSCAIWEYENVRSTITRRSYFKNQFAKIFGRPPISSDIFWVIAGINLAVFSLFRFSHNYNHILTLFPLHTRSKPIALLSSMFTHMEPFHLLLNMYVLHTFSPLINYFGAPHFVAVYITGGMVSGLSSVVFKSVKNIHIPSVGASGAILSIIGMFASINPETRFGIPIISDLFNFSFSAKTAIAILLTVDTCGLLFMKSSRFDHMCHISAVLFGLFYGWIGKRIFWESRKTWMSWYYSFRSR